MKKEKVAQSVAIIGEDDGPTAVFRTGALPERKKIFPKITRKRVIAAVAVILALFLSINAVYSFILVNSIFGENGSESFFKYSYGEDGLEEKKEKSNKEWFASKGAVIQTENFEGKLLEAIEIENENVSESYMILCHQYGAEPSEMAEYAKHFYELGFNIVVPYLRGHGESPYKNISMGWGDSEDIPTWIEKIIEKDKDASIVLFGVSMGANAVTLAAAQELPENVKMVFADSCYTSLSDLIKGYVKSETPFSPFFVSVFSSAMAEKKIGVSLKDADTISVLKNIDLPIMFINAECDTAVAAVYSKRLYENCDAQGVEEVIIPKGSHGESIAAGADEYWGNIDMFILNNF